MRKLGKTLGSLVLAGACLFGGNKAKADVEEHRTTAQIVNAMFYNENRGLYQGMLGEVGELEFYYGIDGEEFVWDGNQRIVDQTLGSWYEGGVVSTLGLHVEKSASEGFAGDWVGIRFFNTEDDIRRLNFQLESDIPNGFAVQVVHNISGVDNLVTEYKGVNSQYQSIDLGVTPGSNYLEFRLQNQLKTADANVDDRVDVFDLAILGNHYRIPGDWEWQHGDFDGDGRVNVYDLGILANHYGEGVVGGQPIPEPLGVSLLALGGLGLMKKRKKV